MSSVQLYNKISSKGLFYLDEAGVSYSDKEPNPDAILLRSHKLHDMTFNPALKAIGRAGAGVNNIPVEECTRRNVVVFNTPGANANAVKELVLAGLLLASRDIVGGINYSRSLIGKGEHISKLIEEQKSSFKGNEILGKTLAVIGLGAIGVMVANAAADLGMTVLGYDPFISVDHAWGLSTKVEKQTNLQKLLKRSDFITLHMPLTKETQDFINEDNIQFVKSGATLLNFSREGIINENAVLSALDSRKLYKYVTDFPTEKTIEAKHVIPTPHLGASTDEAEENCAVMISKQVRDFLLFGNITNSVNFPNCSLEKTAEFRLTIANDNIPNMVGQMTKVLADDGLNISEMLNKSKNEIAYNIIDFNGKPSSDLIQKLERIDGVRFARLFAV